MSEIKKGTVCKNCKYVHIGGYNTFCCDFNENKRIEVKEDNFCVEHRFKFYYETFIGCDTCRFSCSGNDNGLNCELGSDKAEKTIKCNFYERKKDD